MHVTAQGSGLRRGIALLAIALGLSGCDGTVAVDLTVSGADVFDVASLPVDGIEFRNVSGGTAQLRFSNSRKLDLLDARDGQSVALVSDDRLPQNTYDGVRLILSSSEVANNARFQRINGESAPVTLGTTSFAPIDLKVSQDENYSVLLTLELPFSVSLVRAAGDQLFRPALRAAESDQGASVSGSVDASLAEASGCSDDDGGRAVYAFPEQTDVFDDYNTASGSAFQPVAAAAVKHSGSGYRYELRGLDGGKYVLALTCQANLDNPLTPDALSFVEPTTVTLKDGEDATLDLPENN
ncbi:DUF4382 domain-containing protein [Sinimarinibacterium sp. CAU 1509]|uniref:DUF4382 domain-containing protein n=1 Tax=Sinimarinibacterium sp. CAU 1509 TaxID=2562283 RepID=UPI0010ACE455|nr:DUF4382 domain-containing protein [Sinimarinibacterium sp. CAU 1509]TJY59384.1 DUF4382 domain-containing protein [Sinimarinibacterium sp. CAU 1509]